MPPDHDPSDEAPPAADRRPRALAAPPREGPRRRRNRVRRWPRVLAALLLVAAIAGAALLLRGPPDIDFRARADAAARAGDAAAAIIDYKNHLQRQPGDLAARRLLGKLYLEVRQPAAALKELKRASRLRAEFPDLDLDLARAHLALGKPEQGLAALQRHRGPPTPERIALEANLRAALGDTATARALLDEKRANGGTDAALELATARLAFAERDFDGALAAVERALSLAPGQGDALRLKGGIALAARRPALAAEAFTQVLDGTPGDVEALAGLTESLLADNRPDAAAPVLARLRKAAPRSPLPALYEGWLAHARGHWAEAATALASLLAALPDHPLGQLLAADAALRLGQPARAEQLLTSFLAREPRHALARRQLALALSAQGRTAETVALLATLSSESPEDAGLLALLGQAYFAQGDRARGAEALARAATLAPDSTPLQIWQALAQVMGGESAAGVSALERLAAAAPEHDLAREGLARAQLLSGAPDAALATARALVASRPDDPAALQLLAVAAADVGDEAEARKALDAALRTAPDFAPALSLLGMLELRAGQSAAARARFEAALASDPRHEPAALALAGLALADGEPAAAAAGLEQFAAAAPTAAEARWWLAGLRLDAGDTAQARRLADAALALAPAAPAHRLRWSLVQLGAGDAEAAYHTLAELHAAEAGNPTVTLLYADAARATGRTAEASAAYEALAAESPTAPAPWRGLLALALAAGDSDGASRAIARLRELAPGSPDADEADAALALQRRDPAAAVAPLLAAFGKEPVTARLLQLAEAERAAGDAAGAHARLTQWLATHPEDVAAREAQGMMALRDGDRVQAVAAFEAVLASAPRHPIALNNLATLYDEAGDPRALDYAERARDALPEHPATADTLGWILVRQGQVQRGLRLLEEAVGEMPDDPSIAFHHAFALDADGQPAEALARIEALLSRHAVFPQREAAEALLIRLRDFGG
jgi:putative PEP-CTERM system TPR-repeat lipoprotein